MKNWKMTLLAVAAAACLLILTAGCGGDDNTAAETEKAASAEAATEVAVHDCDGGCGMTDVAVDKMTVVDGKYYCAGCAKKAEGEDHSGHDHK